nr:uncharacterized protein LOC106619917 [Bactrocera oleae]
MVEESERSGSIIKLLIRCRLDMEAEFAAGKKKKAVLWGRVLESMKAVNPEIKDSKEAIQRKFLNMLASYKRIKKRNKSTGRDATSWEYFEEFNAVYGSRHSIEPPLENLLSSLGSPTCEDSDCGDSDSYLGSASKRSKKSQNETLTFLKAESSQEQKRHDELVQLEREKLEIEKEKISVLSALREILANRI